MAPGGHGNARNDGGVNMGQWNITIRGTGAHHNRDADGKASHPQDADRMLSRFVRELRKAGHSLASATITHGGEQDVLANPSPADIDPPGNE